MKKTKILSVVALCLMMIFVFSSCKIVDNTTIATVNGEKITKGEFAVFFARIQDTMLQEAGISYGVDAENFWNTTEIEGKNALDVAKERALEEAVKIKVKVQKAKELDAELLEEELATIDSEIGQNIAQAGGMEAYEAEIKSFGSTVDGYENWLRSMYAADKVNNAIAVQEENIISNEAAAERIKSTYIKAKHILFLNYDEETQLPLGAEAAAEQKATAERVMNEIKAGGDFDKLMKEYTQDPGIEESPDGYIFGKGHMIKEFEEAAYALEVGQVSDFVKTTHGIHIIKREPLNMTDDIVTEYLDTEKMVMQNEKIEEIVSKWVSEAEVKIDEKALKKLTPLTD